MDKNDIIKLTFIRMGIVNLLILIPLITLSVIGKNINIKIIFIFLLAIVILDLLSNLFNKHIYPIYTYIYPPLKRLIDFEKKTQKNKSSDIILKIIIALFLSILAFGGDLPITAELDLFSYRNIVLFVLININLLRGLLNTPLI